MQVQSGNLSPGSEMDGCKSHWWGAVLETQGYLCQWQCGSWRRHGLCSPAMRVGMNYCVDSYMPASYLWKMEWPKDFSPLIAINIRGRLGQDSGFQFRNSSFLACNFFAAAFSSPMLGSLFTGLELSCWATAPMQAQHLHNHCPSHIVPSEGDYGRESPFAMSEPAGTIKGTTE